MSEASSSAATRGLKAFEHQPGGIGPALNAERDLLWKKEFSVNSWFTIGHFEADGHKLNFLYHPMILSLPTPGPVIQAAVSITNETTGWYSGGDAILPLQQAEVAEDRFSIQMPNGSMQGDFAELHVKATVQGGSVDLSLSADGPVLFNGGTGVFPFLGMKIHQYSVPRLKATGTIVADGRTYAVDGVTWFDRQWQHQDFPPKVRIKWTWMDINLDNGDAISFWSAFDESIGRELAWATILHADGSHSVVSAEPISNGEADLWTSEVTGNTYPTRWTVRIPQFDATFEVVPSPRKQEIVSQFQPLHRYEGASAITGTYKGRKVSGFGYVELVGEWH